MNGLWLRSKTGNELEGTLGKGTESLLLGDGDAPLRFSSIARQAGYRVDDELTSQETLDSA